MLDSVRGKVSNVERATQERDFTGLRYGNITPTDIDGLIEFRNKCYVIYEGKHISANPMLYGQRVALERLCDDLQKVKPTILICFEHDTKTKEAIDFASCKVKSYRWEGIWHSPKRERSVKEVSDAFIEKHGEWKNICPSVIENTVFPQTLMSSSLQEADGTSLRNVSPPCTT